MTLASLLPLLLAGSIDVGGRVGVALPAGGLARSHNSAAAVAAQLGWTLGRFRLELGYTFAGLTGREAGSYRLDIHEAVLGGGWEILHRPAWGLELSAGAGLGFVRRALGPAREAGRVPSAHLGAGLVQHEGRSRLSLVFDNALFIESPASSAGRSFKLTWLPQVRAGVGYVL